MSRTGVAGNGRDQPYGSTGGEHLFGSCGIPWCGGACLVGDDRHEPSARFPYLPDSDVRMTRAWAMPAEQVSPEHE